MATTLNTLLTAAGCPVSAGTTTVVIQNYQGPRPPIGSNRVDQISATMLNGTSTTGGTDTRLNNRINISGNTMPRCIAYDTAGGYVYVPVATANNFNPVRFVKVALSPTVYVNSNVIIPVITDDAAYQT